LLFRDEEWSIGPIYGEKESFGENVRFSLKKLMPKTLFKYKLKQFLLNHFNLS